MIHRDNLQSHLPASAAEGPLPEIWNLLALSVWGRGAERKSARREAVLCSLLKLKLNQK